MHPSDEHVTHPGSCRRIVVSASSKGGIQALREVLSRLPANFPAPIVLVQHRGVGRPWLLPEVPSKWTKLKVLHAHAGQKLRPGTVYVASPEEHIVVHADRSIGYTDGRRIRHLLSSANPLFESASKAYGPGVVAMVLTGYDHDATDGAQSVKKHGGIVIAQEASTCEEPGMPTSAIKTGSVDHVVPLEAIADTLLTIVKMPREQPSG